MKKLMILAVMMIAAMSANAQTPEEGAVFVRPMAGVTLSSYGVDISSAGGSYKSKYKVGFTVGAEVGYQVNSWFQPSLGVFYSQQGSKMKEKVITAIGTESSTYSSPADYLVMPVLANFYVADGLALKAGVQPGILLSAKYDGADIKDAMKSFQLQIPVGVSYEYQNFVLDARMFIPVTKAAKSTDGKDIFQDDIMNNAFAITVGYNFKL